MDKFIKYLINPDYFNRDEINFDWRVLSDKDAAVAAVRIYNKDVMTNLPFFSKMRDTEFELDSYSFVILSGCKWKPLSEEWEKWYEDLKEFAVVVPDDVLQSLGEYDVEGKKDYLRNEAKDLNYDFAEFKDFSVFDLTSILESLEIISKNDLGSKDILNWWRVCKKIKAD